MPEATGQTDRDRALPASQWLRRAAGAVLLGGMIRLVAGTSRVVFEPPDAIERLRELMPFIYCCWHGQGFLAFQVLTFDKPHTNVLVSLHPDGEFPAGAARSLGMKLIEGSGSNYKEPVGTGGATALRRMLRALRKGEAVALTADVPPEPGRTVSEGVVWLARVSGRPIVPFATSSSRRKVITSQWDQVQVNLPFSRIGAVAGEPIWVPENADLRSYSKRIGEALDQVLERAFAIADGAPPRG